MMVFAEPAELLYIGLMCVSLAIFVIRTWNRSVSSCMVACESWVVSTDIHALLYTQHGKRHNGSATQP